MATTPNPKKVIKTKKILPSPSSGLKKADYLSALEVAGQPAKTAAAKKMKLQAKADKKYLEQKFPKYTAKVGDFGTRTSLPNWSGKSKKPKMPKGPKSPMETGVRSKPPRGNIKPK